jgi:hypothetical protein
VFVIAWLYPWVLLVILQFLFSNISFVGHLSGILIGYLWVHGCFNFLSLPRAWLVRFEHYFIAAEWSSASLFQCLSKCFPLWVITPRSSVVADCEWPFVTRLGQTCNPSVLGIRGLPSPVGSRRRANDDDTPSQCGLCTSIRSCWNRLSAPSPSGHVSGIRSPGSGRVLATGAQPLAYDEVGDGHDHGHDNGVRSGEYRQVVEMNDVEAGLTNDNTTNVSPSSSSSVTPTTASGGLPVVTAVPISAARVPTDSRLLTGSASRGATSAARDRYHDNRQREQNKKMANAVAARLASTSSGPAPSAPPATP